MNKAKAGLLFDYSGLTVAAATEIRRQFRGIGVEYRVMKNTLFKRVIKGTPREGLAKALVHTRAVAFNLVTNPSQYPLLVRQYAPAVVG